MMTKPITVIAGRLQNSGVAISQVRISYCFSTLRRMILGALPKQNQPYSLRLQFVPRIIFRQLCWKPITLETIKPAHVFKEGIFMNRKPLCRKSFLLRNIFVFSFFVFITFVLSSNSYANSFAQAQNYKDMQMFSRFPMNLFAHLLFKKPYVNFRNKIVYEISIYKIITVLIFGTIFKFINHAFTEKLLWKKFLRKDVAITDAVGIELAWVGSRESYLFTVQ